MGASGKRNVRVKGKRRFLRGEEELSSQERSWGAGWEGNRLGKSEKTMRRYCYSNL